MTHSQFIPEVFDPDPYNRHYDDRRTWLAWRDPDPPAVPLRVQVGHALVRFGGWVAGQRPAPALDATSA